MSKPLDLRQRRFEEVHAPNPTGVRPLGDDHPAILQGLPLFPTTIVSAKESPRLLISGQENRKIGKVVTRGDWKGAAIFTLTLAERATCPISCSNYRTCYGNAMPFSRRHQHGADLEARLPDEVADLLSKHPLGIVVRLHVLGDFYSTEYVALWRSLLERHPLLRVFGYTARLPGSASELDHEIGLAIRAMNKAFHGRSAIRFSSDTPLKHGATVIDRVPEGGLVPEGVVCPAERFPDSCCAKCTLCWAASATEKTIVFVRHGMGSKKQERMAMEASKTDTQGMRKIEPIKNLAKVAGAALNSPPTLLWVDPGELMVDESYQRALSSRSLKLISRIVANWNWTHLKPPIVVKDEETDTFFVVDGQHTAIAAASHPGISKIPIMVVDADAIAARAAAFISHNRDRVAVTPMQLFYSSLAAGDSEAIAVQQVCSDAGVMILRMPPAYGKFQIGETIALASIRKALRTYGADRTVMILHSLVLAGRAPVRSDEIKGLSLLLERHPSITQPAIVEALRNKSYDEVLRDARDIAQDGALPLAEAMASVYARMLLGNLDVAASRAAETVAA